MIAADGMRDGTWLVALLCIAGMAGVWFAGRKRS